MKPPKVTKETIAGRIREAIDGMPEEMKAPAKRWFFDAHKEAERIGNGDAKKGAAIISALSPRVRWAKNIEAAEALVSGDLAAVRSIAIGRFILDAYDFAYLGRDPETITGPKRRAFMDNLADPEKSEAVTVDSWMHKFMHEYKSITPRAYRLCSEAVRIVAEERNERPHETQALAWTALRGTHL